MYCYCQKYIGHAAQWRCYCQRKGQVQVLQPAHVALRHCDWQRKGQVQTLQLLPHCGVVTGKERSRHSSMYIQPLRHCGASYWQRKGQLQVLYTGNAALRCFLLTKEGPGTGFAVSAALCREEAEWAAVGGALVLDGRQVLVRTVRRVVATVRVLKYTELINDTVS